MASSPDKVASLLHKVWKPAKASAVKEREALEMMLSTSTCGQGEERAQTKKTKLYLEPWDWRFLAEQVRAERYDIDDSQVKPYFELSAVVNAAFDCANRLFGIKFTPIANEDGYHPDVTVYRVTEGDDDALIGIFLHDNFSRSGKQSGAWMSELRTQTKNGREGLSKEMSVPIVLNNNNFAKGEPTLLSFSDARTLFHELGHGMHGLLSDVTYERLSGTSVLRDFVELPSQLFEHWLEQEQVIKKHFRHFQTGEAIPDALLKKMFAAQKFNMGFSTVEYCASALVDLALHRLGTDDVAHVPNTFVTSPEGEPLAPLLDIDVGAFEKDEALRLGLPQGIVLRHRPAHFQHIFSTSAYASAYYVYLWAEVLDADAFDAFKETGDIFDQTTAQRLRECIYSKGNSEDPAVLFERFRGRAPAIEPMMHKKGLLTKADA